MPVDVLALPTGSLSTKWKEPYASASLNQRFVGIIAPGIYRGLLLAPDPSLGDRTITVEADPDKADHVAVYENADGYSISYRDSSSGSITLSLTAYASTTVIISLFVTYAPGVQTTGTYRVFTVAEFNALDPSIKNALVVLGTVVVPASGAIPSGNISLLNRTLASSNLSRGVIPNAQVIRNPGFEVGETNATHPKSSLFWDKSMTVGTGTWKTSTTQVSTGMKSIELNVTAGPVSGEISQPVGVPAQEDQLFLIFVDIKQLKTITTGSLVFFMEWSDVNDALLTTTTVTLDGGGVDSSFRSVNTIIPAPAGVASLRAVGVRATLLNPSTTGIFGYIDNIDVLVEPLSAASTYPFDQTFRRTLSGTSLALLDKTGTFASQQASLRFDPSTPTSEGRILVEPGNPANLPPALGWLGRLHKLGSSLLASEANALKPRVEADISVAASTEFTLMWESARAGESAGTYTQPVVRMYAAATGMWMFTVNATWASTTWNKDINGQEAFKLELQKGQFGIFHQIGGTNTWADASWLTASTMTNGQLSLLLGTVSSKFTFTPTALTHAADILPASTALYKVGSDTVQLLKAWTRAAAIGPDPTDDPVSLLTLKGDWNYPTQTEQVQFEYVSKYFGIWSRKGHRFATDWDTGTSTPAGWTTTSSGATVSTTLQTSDHRVTVGHTGGTAGTHQLHTVPSIKFRLTDGVVCRIRFKHGMGADFTTPRIGFRDVTGNINALTFGPTVVDGGGSHAYGFLVGSGSTIVGANDHAFSASMRWMTFAVIGSRLFWSYDLLNPDDTVSPSDSFPTSGSSAITVPTGTFNFSILASGGGGSFGSSCQVDFVEIVSGNREP